jgi:hypothetical protein
MSTILLLLLEVAAAASTEPEALLFPGRVALAPAVVLLYTLVLPHVMLLISMLEGCSERAVA